MTAKSLLSCARDDGLDGILATLAAIPKAELAVLQATADNAPQFAPGLLAFISHGCEWELGRRRGFHFVLNGPLAAISPQEMVASFAALAVLTVTFGEHSPISRLLAAIGDALDSEPPAVH